MQEDIRLYLKKLEINGFKSFAHKTELYFKPGMTAIVGPNGSGKSNILDAIYWVLGEQSAKMLRGSSMQDVIFAGNSKRKGSGRAEVSLILDNTDGYFPLDFSEVKLTRRVLRSGESEYFMNKTPCRLKDIHEILADKGIGKEAYTLIGQGKIEEVLNAKPEIRRKIIEEAAGVTKYKWKKKETEKKLSETQGHLYRVNDLHQEVSTQLEPLEEQAEKACAFKELERERETLEIYFLMREMIKTNQHLQEAQSSYEGLNKQYEEYKHKIAAHEQENDVLKGKIAEIGQEIEQLREALDQDKEIIEQLERSQAIDYETEKHVSANTLRIEEEMTGLKEKQAETIKQLEAEQQERNNLCSKIEVEKQNLAAMEAQYQCLEEELVQKQGTINERKEKFFTFLNQLADCRNKLYRTDEKQEMIVHKQERLLKEKREKMVQTQDIEEKLNNAKDDQTTLQEKQFGLQEMIKNLHIKRQELEKTIKSIQSEAEDIREKERMVQSQLKVTGQMQDNYEGYYAGVKGVLRSAKQQRLQGICGSVAEIIQVPKTYEKSIEVALGGALQNIVTLSQRYVEPAIQYLKQSHLGRATFLPLDVVKASTLTDYEKNIIKKEKAIGVGLDLVNYEETFANVAAFLLGRIIVAQDFAHAQKLAKALSYRLKVVTLEGEVINPGGAMTGGSLGKKTSSLIGRKRVLKELQEKEATLRGMRLQKEREGQAYLDKRVELEQSAASAQNESHQKDMERIALEKDITQWQEAWNQAISDSRSIEVEEAAVADEIIKIEKEKQIFQLDLGNLENEEETRQSEVLSLEERLKQEQDHLKEIMLLMTKKKMDVAAWQEKGLTQEKTHISLKGLSRDIQQQIQNKAEEKRILLKKQEDLQNRVCDRKKQIDRCSERKKEKEDHLGECRLELKNDTDHLAQQEERLSQYHQDTSHIQENLYSGQRKVDRLQMQWEILVGRCQKEFELEAEEAIRRFEKQNTPPGGLKRLKEIKSEIRKLGTVNLAAISLFEEMKQREAFLREQYDDLMESQKTLQRIIDEMDQVVKKRFFDTFLEVNAAFEDIFALLFKGGKAQLVLTEPEQLLETGIEIIAQPKGKKLQSISLLSGGEKAMTALAFLFALLHVKPSPFCILDEVEAALDEANVDRLGQYLESLSQSTQVIVITHRKETMEKAQVLYGVTMQEVGVSKLVSMKLTS